VWFHPVEARAGTDFDRPAVVIQHRCDLLVGELCRCARGSTYAREELYGCQSATLVNRVNQRSQVLRCELVPESGDVCGFDDYQPYASPGVSTIPLDALGRSQAP